MTGTATLTTDESTMDSTGPAIRVTPMSMVAPRDAVPPARGRLVPVTGWSRSWGRRRRGPGQVIQPAEFLALLADVEVQHPHPPWLRRRGLRPHRGEVGDGRLDDRPAGPEHPQLLPGIEIIEERDARLDLVVVGQQGRVGVPDHRLQQVMAGVRGPVHVARWAPRVRLGGH